MKKIHWHIAGINSFSHEAFIFYDIPMSHGLIDRKIYDLSEIDEIAL